MAIQNDGKILVGGRFTDYNGTPRQRIARINTDGTIDTSFVVGSGFNADVKTIALGNLTVKLLRVAVLNLIRSPM
jgi:hypothetical protein